MKSMNRLAPKIEVEFGSGVTGNFLLIPAGAFYVGGLKDHDVPRRLVAITKPYYMQETTVTQRQYEIITGQNPATFNDEPENPVEQVSWDNAVDFADNLTRLVGLHFGLTARLPTELEWEYAARGGDGDKYKYAGSNYINEVAWYHDNSKEQTHPVKQKKPNGYGLYDMTGNVWEWCSDKSAPYPNQELIDYQGSASGPNRVFRGGSGSTGLDNARIAKRNANFPHYHNLTLGFRLVLEAP